MLHFDLSTTFAGISEIRPILKLALATVKRRLEGLRPEEVFADLDGFAIAIQMVRFEQLGLGVPMESPTAPGRVAYRKSERLLTIDCHYNEISMVHDRLNPDPLAASVIAVPRDFLETFAERLETCVARCVDWCDRKKAWRDRERFVMAWESAVAAVRRAKFARPYEFALDGETRAALDAAWALLARCDPAEERHEALGAAYFLLRDLGWAAAEYETRLDGAKGFRGAPLARVANHGANAATGRADTADVTYLFA